VRGRSLNKNMTGDVHVWLRGGRYELSETLLFDERDSGSNDKNVIYQAYESEQPVICGGKKVTGWQPVPDKPYFVAKVPRHTPVVLKGQKDGGHYPMPYNPQFYDSQAFASDGFADYFAQLYVNGVRAVRAQSQSTIPLSRKEWWDDAGTPWFRDGLYVRKPGIEKYTNPGDIRLLWVKYFKSADVPVTGITAEGADEAVIKLMQPGFNTASGWNGIKKDPQFFIINALEELDVPGEWYLDQKKRLVYYYPFQRDGDLNKAEVLAPNVEFLVRIAGSALAPARNLRFEGITFQCGNWTGAQNEYLGLSQAEIFKDYSSEIPGQIILDHAANIAIVGCTVQHMGSCGIQPYEYCRDILIEGNTTDDTTGAGISVGHFWFNKRYCQTESVPTNITVANNIVRNTGRDYWQGTGINVFTANNAMVYHNDVSDIAYTAIHARVGDDGNGRSFTHPAIGHIDYKWNKVSRAFQGHKWGIGDGGHLYFHGRYADCVVAENYSLHGNRNINNEYYNDNAYNISWINNVSRGSKAHRSIFGDEYGSSVVYKNNYADRALARNVTLVKDGQWPDEAKKIMTNAGLEPKWQNRLNTIYGHENLAEGKSSTDAAGADDNWNTDYNGPGAWQVDLGEKHVIQRITLMPKLKGADEDSMRNIEVQASNDAEFKECVTLCEQNELPWYHKTSPECTNMWEQYIPAMPGYRYLRVKSTNPAGKISFAEFEVFGYPEKTK
ncbi:MAG TPA: hypothetical protein VF258_01435, partial [Luteolibacter sp.]